MEKGSADNEERLLLCRGNVPFRASHHFVCNISSAVTILRVPIVRFA